MSVLLSQKYKKRDWTKITFMEVDSYKKYLERIKKTFYYGNLPSTERLSLPLTELAADLYSEVKARHSVERLRLEEASEINRNACVSPCTLVLAIIYLEQLKTNCCYIDSVTPSELFIVSLIIATKFLNDCGEEGDILNSEWAISVGLSLNEVNRLEREFLAAIDWNVFIEQSNFWKRLRILERDIALQEGNKRGWFSYTDLENLLDTLNGLAIAHTIFTVSAVCLASYAAGLLTVIGSTLLVSQLPKYSISSQHSFNCSSEALNISAESVTTISAEVPDGQIWDLELPTERYVNTEIREYIQPPGQYELNLEIGKNISNYRSNYLTYLSNYIKMLSGNIHYLPLKIGTLSMDSSYFLNNCFSW